MKRDAYDKVQSYLKANDGATVTKALAATKVATGTYYSQMKNAKPTRRPRKAAAAVAEPTYDLEVITRAPTQEVRPGMVAIMGAPADVAAMLVKLATSGGIAR